MGREFEQGCGLGNATNKKAEKRRSVRQGSAQLARLSLCNIAAEWLAEGMRRKTESKAVFMRDTAYSIVIGRQWPNAATLSFSIMAFHSRAASTV